MRFTLTIDSDNAAFGETHQDRCDEVARILRKIAADHMDAPGNVIGYPKDVNGNIVGRYAFVSDFEETGRIAELRGLLSCYADPRFRVTPAFTRRVAAALEATKAEG